ncbi:hypothetical protein SAMN05444157_3458 [Frankineae bacterium MT45]|nr:hypothetical protein SAMN05444157_3458 [Frankineae bacterium MT45]
MQLLELRDPAGEPRLPVAATAESVRITPRPLPTSHPAATPAPREIVLTSAMVADVLVAIAAALLLVGGALAGFVTMTWHVGDFDAGAPLFIALGDKVLLIAGAVCGAAIGGLVAFLLLRAVRVAMGRPAPGDE